MRLGVHLVNFTLPDGPGSIGPAIAAVGRASEEAGVDNLSLMDHYLQLEYLSGPGEPMLEGYTALGFLAAHTSSVDLQLLTTGVTYRHPGLLAKIVPTLDVLSGGRATLAIGAACTNESTRGPGSPSRRLRSASSGWRRPADRAPDVERRRRTLRRSALPAR